LGILFAFATKHGYAASNPVEGIERPEVGDLEIKVLSVPEASKLLANSDEESRPVLAIGLFAGLRMSEILALNWEEIDLCDRTITVQGRKAKTRQRRVVTISDNLHDWLALSPTENELDRFGCRDSGDGITAAWPWMFRAMPCATALGVTIMPYTRMKT
jgi:site-specific recombinase XerC